MARDAHYRKPEPEVRLTELFPVYQEISHARRNLKSWSKPHSVRGSLGMFGTTAQVRYQPRGVGLIIAPWNYPVHLPFGPVVSALAAGKTVMLKPSERTPPPQAANGHSGEDTCRAN